MAFSETTEARLSLLQRLCEAGEYFVGCLLGLFMMLWGIFPGGGDLLLTGAGLVILLGAGYYCWQALTEKRSG